MKKLIYIAAIVVTCLITSCKQSTDYQAKGAQMASRMDELCQQNDTAGVLALNDSILAVEDEIAATGDATALDAFKTGLGDIQQRMAPFITVAKMDQGATKEEAVQPVIDGVLTGEGNVDINTVTSSIDAALKKEKEEKQAAKSK